MNWYKISSKVMTIPNEVREHLKSIVPSVIATAKRLFDNQEEDSMSVSEFTFNNPYTKQEEKIEYYVSFMPDFNSTAWHSNFQGRNDIILNAAHEDSFNGGEQRVFWALIHEVVHAIDPKRRKKEFSDTPKAYQDENATQKDKFDYFSHPVEFEAFTLQFTEEIERVFYSLPEYMRDLWVERLLQSLRKMDFVSFFRSIKQNVNKEMVDLIKNRPTLARNLAQRMVSKIQQLPVEKM